MIKAWCAKWWPWLAGLFATILGLTTWRKYKQREAEHLRALEELHEGERERERTEKHLIEATDTQTTKALIEQADERARASVAAGKRADEAEAERFSAHQRVKEMSARERWEERQRQKAERDRRRSGLRVLGFLFVLSSASAEAQLPPTPKGPITFDEHGTAKLSSGTWHLISEDEQVSLLATGLELRAALKEIEALRESGNRCAASNESLRGSVDAIQRAHRIATELRLDAQAVASKAEADRKAAEEKAAKRWRWAGGGVVAGVIATVAIAAGAR